MSQEEEKELVCSSLSDGGVVRASHSLPLSRGLANIAIDLPKWRKTCRITFPPPPKRGTGQSEDEFLEFSFFFYSLASFHSRTRLASRVSGSLKECQERNKSPANRILKPNVRKERISWGWFPFPILRPTIVSAYMARHYERVRPLKGSRRSLADHSPRVVGGGRTTSKRERGKRRQPTRCSFSW